MSRSQNTFLENQTENKAFFNVIICEYVLFSPNRTTLLVSLLKCELLGENYFNVVILLNNISCENV